MTRAVRSVRRFPQSLASFICATAGAIAAAAIICGCIYFSFQDTIDFVLTEFRVDESLPRNVETLLQVWESYSGLGRTRIWPFQLYFINTWLAWLINILFWFCAAIPAYSFFRAIKSLRILFPFAFGLLIVCATILSRKLSHSNLFVRGDYEFFSQEIRQLIFFAVMSGIWLGIAGGNQLEERKFYLKPIFSLLTAYDFALLSLASACFFGILLFRFYRIDPELFTKWIGWPFEAREIGFPSAIVEIILLHIVLIVFGRNSLSNRFHIRALVATMILVPFFITSLHPDFVQYELRQISRESVIFEGIHDFGFFLLLSYVLFATMNAALIAIGFAQKMIVTSQKAKVHPKNNSIDPSGDGPPER